MEGGVGVWVARACQRPTPRLSFSRCCLGSLWREALPSSPFPLGWDAETYGGSPPFLAAQGFHLFDIVCRLQRWVDEARCLASPLCSTLVAVPNAGPKSNDHHTKEVLDQALFASREPRPRSKHAPAVHSGV